MGLCGNLAHICTYFLSFLNAFIFAYVVSFVINYFKCWVTCLSFIFAYAGIKWSAWLEPFQYQLWLTIFGMINFILIVIWWVDRKSPYGHYKKLDSGDDGFTLLGISFCNEFSLLMISLCVSCSSASVQFRNCIIYNNFHIFPKFTNITRNFWPELLKMLTKLLNFKSGKVITRNLKLFVKNHCSEIW